MIREPSWEQLYTIEQEHGDAFYLIDLDAFCTCFHELRDAFRAHYANTQLGYSYKTNYLPRFCRLVHSWGGYAEVVSRMEYEMALRAGVTPERIIFNGPYKSPADLRMAMDAGALVNLDSPYQVRALEEMDGLAGSIRVGVRCNFDVGGDRVSRFGFDAQGPELRTMVDRLRALPAIEVAGLHCHFALPGRLPAAYERVAKRMVALAGELFPDAPPRFIDIGGGYFSKMRPELADQFGGDVPAYTDYAAAVGPVLASAYPNGATELILEPGVSVTATAAELVTRVLDVRPVRGTWFAQVSTSIQAARPTMNKMNLPIRLVHAPGQRPPAPAKPVDVVGYTCMEIDVIHRGLEGEIAPADYLILENCGAYTNVQKMPFIRAAPAMVTLNENGEVDEVLRRAETTEDILITYAD